MKRLKLLQLFLIVVTLGTFVFFTSSCSKENNAIADVGTVTGIISDELGIPIADVNVSISGMDNTTTSGSDGKYVIENVPVGSYSMTFARTGYQTTNATIASSKFNSEKVAIINITMVSAPAKIVGTVIDAKNDNAPLEGVKVSVNDNDTAITDAEGKYEIQNLPIADYTITFSKTDYATITRIANKDAFIDNVDTVNVRMGGTEILPGLVIEDLEKSTAWLYDEYRGGRNSDDYPHWDWSTDYMCTLDFSGNWQEQNEGTTLRVQNVGAQQNNPADLNHFDSFIYGRKKITADNNIMSLRIRTHDATTESPAYFGVQVVDLSAANPTAVKIGGDYETYASSDYSDFAFDLSAYEGKEIVIAIGIYRAQTGDFYNQLVLRSIRFSTAEVTGINWISGTEVVNGWHLTQEMVRSTMTQTKTSFTGISPVTGNRDNYVDAYRSWRDISFIANEWSYVPLHKDPEVFPSEGYIIKTRSDAGVNTQEPESYLYAKFDIASGKDKMTLKTRNFSTNATFFKFTVIEEDGTVTNISPSSNTADDASAADNGCWKFVHQAGSGSDPDSYATFNYDLSQFDGKTVVIVLGVYKGEQNSDENKMAIYSIDFN